MTTSYIKGNYKKDYDFTSTERNSGEVMLVKPQKETGSYPLTDSNKKVGTLGTTILEKFNIYAQELVTKVSGIAFENGIHVLLKGYRAGYNVKIVDCLQNDDGIFIDFMRGESYRAFELYNDGAIIQINKNGTQNSIVSEHDTIQELNL